MSDPVYPPHFYLAAHDIVSHIAENLAIQFRMEGDSMTREQAEKNIKDRHALIRAQEMILDAGEHAMGEPPMHE